MSEPLISIIVPNHNSGGLLRRCLTSLYAQVDHKSCQVIVVDDGSTDASCDCVEQFPEVVLVRQSNAGAAAARNRGLPVARGSVICFLDADCRAEPDWVNEITSPILAERARVTVGRFDTSQTDLVPRLIQQELEGRLKRMRRFQKVDFLNSATCAFSRPVFESFRFDPAFQKLEDVELSFRLAASGLLILYVPSAAVDHAHPHTLRHYLSRKFKYGRAAPALYRRFPGKSLRDASTPMQRRLQLGLVGLGLAALPWSPIAGIVLVISGLLAVLPTAATAWKNSPVQALVYPFFSLTGSLSLLAGTVTGTFFPDRQHEVSNRAASDQDGDH